MKRLQKALLENSIRTLHLSLRAVNALERARIYTVRQLREKSRGGFKKIRGGGERFEAQIFAAIEALAQSRHEDGIDWHQYARFRKYLLLPEELPPVGHRSAAMIFETLVAALRSSLNEAEVLVFQEHLSESNAKGMRELSKHFGLTFQGIALMKDNAVRTLRGALLSDDYTNCAFRFRAGFAGPFRAVQSHLSVIGPRAHLLSEWLAIVADASSLDPREVRSLERTLLAIFQYHKLGTSGGRCQPIVVPKQRILAGYAGAVAKIDRLLRMEHPDGLALERIAEELRREPGTELIFEDLPVVLRAMWRVKFDSESSRYCIPIAAIYRSSDHIEQILAQRGAPTPLNELLLELNRSTAEPRSKRHVSYVLTRDKRFRPIGRLGVWTLAEWNIETRSVPEIAAEILQHSKRPMTEKELYRLVVARRPVKLRSIATMLRDDGRFKRVAPCVWQLRARRITNAWTRKRREAQANRS